MYLLGLVESGRFHFTLVFQANDEVVVLPSDGGGEVTKTAGLAAGTHLQVLEGEGHDLIRRHQLNDQVSKDTQASHHFVLSSGCIFCIIQVNCKFKHEFT